MNFTGPVSDQLQAVLAEFPVYREYRAGKITHDQYWAWLEDGAGEIEARLGRGHFRVLASRYPPDFDAQSDEIFSALLADGLISQRPPAEPFEAFRQQVKANFDHGENRTFIHPDEARTLYLLSMAQKPRRLIMIGSYYGYWAIWAMPGVAAAGGQATLIDPNPTVCALAEKNFRAMGFGGRTTVRAAKAETLFGEMAPGIDMVLLDASGGKDNPDSAYHGKGIYAFMIEGVYDKMASGALLVAHNDYLPDVGANPLSQRFLQGGAAKLERFHAFCHSHFRKSRVCPTPDGFGVYLK